MKKKLDIETLLTAEELGPHGSINVPVYLSSTFGFPSVQDAADAFSGNSSAHVYARLSNPTTDVFEEKMAEIECGEGGLAFASGMAAIHAVIMATCKPGDKILCVEEVYGGTHELLKTLVKDLGISVRTFKPDLSNLFVCPKTKLVFAESPTNPSLHTVRLKKLYTRVRGRAPVVVDNTFATPIIQRPLEDASADIVLHSCTKYVCGHGDLIGGVVVSKNLELHNKIKHIRTVSGGIMSPFVAYLCLRGLKTLALRMNRHEKNASALSRLFHRHKGVVKKVHYPGFGGMISIDLGAREKAGEFASYLKVPVVAVSLGETRTLINVPSCMTHSTYTEEELRAVGISPGLVRISTGIEATHDLTDDFGQALGRLR